MNDTPRMYADLASWWPLISPPSDYAEEAAGYLQILLSSVVGPLKTCLELGSGGGNNASFLKQTLTLTLVDCADGMLDHSRTINPECEHHRGDMRDVRLGKTYDAVFIHDAIDYMCSRSELLAAFTTAFVHVREGGALLVCPDHIRERFVPSTDSGGSDGDDGRGVRFLEWMWDPDPDDDEVVTDYAYLLRSADGSVEAAHDRHTHGLFARQVWLDTLAEAGFVPSSVVLPHSELPPDSYELFVGRRPRVRDVSARSPSDGDDL